MFTQVLVPLDRSPLAEQALGQAVAIARASHAALDVVLVHEPLPFAGFRDAPWNAEHLSDDQKYLEMIAKEAMSGATLSVSHAVLEGGPAEMICERARDVDADLIVMTSHGRTGLSRAWLGSIADAVIRRSSVPVLLLRPIDGTSRRDAAHHLFRNVLVLLDGSSLASTILTPALALARSGGGRLILMRVIQPVPSMVLDAGMSFAYPPPLSDDEATEALVEEAKQQLSTIATQTDSDGVVIETHVAVGAHVAQAILDYVNAHEIDVIAMATHGRGASRNLIGSTADKVLRGSGVPMLIHRPTRVVEESQEGKEAKATRPTAEVAAP